MYKIYTRDGCSFCDKAKVLMSEHNIPFQEVSIGKDVQREEVLQLFPGVKMLPIVVDVNGFLVGGYDDLRSVIQQ
jgi:glutaredoxin